MSWLQARNGGLLQLLRLSGLRQPAVQIGQRAFSAEPAPAQQDENITVTVNPFKGHKLDPPSRDVQTNKQELLDMFEVRAVDACLRSAGCTRSDPA